ncbi:hypothetical protein [Streptomyces alanosinicus]|uniref:Uncharacterized protein n=1 Tax=Streptomyces alanosinicus TaxID=68171 RepID=A0A918YGQ6_9ACTN|nr:hypothetical protein [Streptomyces alanosinicus]GHE02608.1 hypothetical protein GCM10010339_26410 [Streptomyces alanosinicus]
MGRPWEADSGAEFVRRLGRSPQELGLTSQTETCPDIWEMSNGDVAVIGRDVTSAVADRLPAGVSIGADERLVIIPRSLLSAAKPDIPDA